MNVLSLFSGVGGFDLGLENAGMKTIYQCEWDKHATGVLELHWPHVPRWGDITTLTGKEILSHGTPPDVVAWGSPCQDLSSIGLRRGITGKRSSLFYEGLRIIKELREETNNEYPKISIWENVAGALTSNRGADFRSVISEMGESGAHLQEYAVLDSSFFGVPQVRRRVFLISIFNIDIAGKCPEILLPVRQVHHRNHSKIEPVKQDQIASFYKVHGRLSTPTINISPPLLTISPICVASKSMRPRKLSSIEHERLMGWPDDHTRYRSDGTEQKSTNRFKQCGNGVVSPVAEWVGKQLMELNQ